jgi:hypothetical protein
MKNNSPIYFFIIGTMLLIIGGVLIFRTIFLKLGLYFVIVGVIFIFGAIGEKVRKNDIKKKT